MPMPRLLYSHARGSGLGSSSAAIVGGLIAGLVLAGHQLPCWGSEELLQLAASIEGAWRMAHKPACLFFPSSPPARLTYPSWIHPSIHPTTGHPDNVAPAIYGGIQLGIHTGERWTTERVNTPPGIQLVLFIPDFIGKTSDARAVLEVRSIDVCGGNGRWLCFVDVIDPRSRSTFSIAAACHNRPRWTGRTRCSTSAALRGW